MSLLFDVLQKNTISLLPPTKMGQVSDLHAFRL